MLSFLLSVDVTNCKYNIPIEFPESFKAETNSKMIACYYVEHFKYASYAILIMYVRN